MCWKCGVPLDNQTRQRCVLSHRPRALCRMKSGPLIMLPIVALIILLVTSGTAASSTADAASAAAAQPSYPVYDIPSGQPLETTPGYSLLMPRQQVTLITITQAPVVWRLSNSAGLQVQFTAPGYLAGASKQAFAFGPTLRLKPGQNLRIQLTNDLVQSKPIMEHQPHAFAGPMDTNLHTHGLWDPNGVYDQNNTAYAGQDNVFVVVPAKKKSSHPAATLDFLSTLLPSHLPGLHWYHPHKHGSTTIQTSTSHGAIIIEDDPFWLPANRGLCGHFQALLASAPEVMLDITLLFFKLAQNPGKFIDSPTYQFVSNTSSPKNPLCCDNKNGNTFGGAMTQGNGSDILLVSGAYKPIITMVDGVWYRWRMLYSGAKGWSTFRFLDSKMQNTQQCEWMLIAKDGVYVLNVPRKVDAVLMASGNRLEALVRCSMKSFKHHGSPSTEFILSATNQNDPFNPGNNATFAEDFFRVWQDEVARIKVVRKRKSYDRYVEKGASYAAAQAAQDDQAAATDSAAPSMSGAGAQPAHFTKWLPFFKYYKSPPPESCTPLRPGYAPDLSDASLTAAGYSPSRVHNQDVNFGGFNNADGLGVTCTVNNELFSFPDANPLVLELGQVEQWTTNNARSHPMHVHTQPFQLTAFNLSNMQIGTALTNFFQVGDFYDTMFIPQIGFGPGSVVMRFQPGPFSGYAVMHCHYLNHEDLGCMKVVQFKCPGYDWVQPVNGICDTFKFPVPGALPIGK